MSDNVVDKGKKADDGEASRRVTPPSSQNNKLNEASNRGRDQWERLLRRAEIVFIEFCRQFKLATGASEIRPLHVNDEAPSAVANYTFADAFKVVYEGDEKTARPLALDDKQDDQAVRLEVDIGVVLEGSLAGYRRRVLAIPAELCITGSTARLWIYRPQLTCELLFPVISEGANQPPIHRDVLAMYESGVALLDLLNRSSPPVTGEGAKPIADYAEAAKRIASAADKDVEGVRYKKLYEAHCNAASGLAAKCRAGDGNPENLRAGFGGTWFALRGAWGLLEFANRVAAAVEGNLESVHFGARSGLIAHALPDRRNWAIEDFVGANFTPEVFQHLKTLGGERRGLRMMLTGPG